MFDDARLNRRARVVNVFERRALDVGEKLFPARVVAYARLHRSKGYDESARGAESALRFPRERDERATHGGFRPGVTHRRVFEREPRHFVDVVARHRNAGAGVSLRNRFGGRFGDGVARGVVRANLCARRGDAQNALATDECFQPTSRIRAERAHERRALLSRANREVRQVREFAVKNLDSNFFIEWIIERFE